MMGTIKLILAFLNKYKTIIVTAITVIITVFMFQTCESNKQLKNDIKEEKRQSTQNIVALTEDLTGYRDRYDNKGFVKPIAELTKDELMKFNPSLYSELENELGEVEIIIRTQIEYRDTGSVENVVSQLDSNEYSLSFDYQSEDSTLFIKGNSTFFAESFLKPNLKTTGLRIQPGKTFIEDAGIKFALSTGIRLDEDGIHRIFVKPSTEKMQVTQLDGAVVTDWIDLSPDKNVKKSRFGIGAFAGYGATIGQGHVVHGPTVGVGLTYTFIKF